MKPKSITTISVLVAFIAITTYLLANSADVLAQSQEIQTGINSAAGGTGADPQTTLNNTIEGIVNILTFIVGAVSVVMIIYGGYLYTTSAGDPGKIATAKKALIFAMIGIAIAAAAQIITRFIVERI